MDNIILYNSGEIELKISLKNKTLWLRAKEIALLFNVQRPAIVKHILNIYKTNELDENSTCSILEQVGKDGKKRNIKYYSLNMIISIGYRVNSKRATKFRIWATKVLKDYIQNNYVINSDKITHQRFKELETEVDIIKQKITILENHNITYKQGIFFNGQIFDV